MPPVGTGSPTLSVTPHMVLERSSGADGVPAAVEDAGVRVQVIDAIGGDLRAHSPGLPALTCASRRRTRSGRRSSTSATTGSRANPGAVGDDRRGRQDHRDATSRGLRVVLEFVPDSGSRTSPSRWRSCRASISPRVACCSIRGTSHDQEARSPTWLRFRSDRSARSSSMIGSNHRPERRTSR